ncbi:MAG: hypothetical protein SFV54_16050 [Bryobacteraceae bacterium]|nr:hypothetical protein [Bryobacteraceae bacterium]
MDDEQLRQLVRRTLDLRLENEKRLLDYGFLRRTHKKQLTSSGEVKSDERFTFKVERREGLRVSYIVERNDQPVPAAELAKTHDRIREVAAERRAETPEQRRKREAGEKKASGERDYLQEFPNAAEFKLAGMEKVGGRDTYIVDFQPRPGYKPKDMKARIFEKVRGRVWIDKAESQFLKMDAEVFDTVSIGFGVLAKIEKGTQFHLEQTRLPDGFWAPAKQLMKFDARVMLVKSMRNEMETTYREFRRLDAPVRAVASAQ